MNIETEPYLEKLGPDHGRIWIKIKVDGIDCGEVIIFSGGLYTCEDLMENEIKLSHIVL